ncbi:unnamed protein product [Prorocentrum cordatum]|uniref:Uncharacterized protein n=1 Tax=Prorocentrum cordatum TaxID=2364126 RepID=A0ABN9Q8F1_9DINO|nr:unnamed protein product [Polarella glacialis]
MVLRRPSATKTKDWKNAPYAGGKNATPGRGLRREQARRKRTVPELLAASDVEIVNILLGDKLLVDWIGAARPFCGRGKLDELAARPRKGDRFVHRCNAKGCQKHVSPARQNPILSDRSTSESLQSQAAVLLARLTGMYAEDAGPTIECSGPKAWADVEADEATFDKLDLTDGPEPLEDPQRSVTWSSGWAFRSAKKYKIVGCKRVLIPPKYVELKTHVLPSGKHLKVKSGAQIIDRAWCSIKDLIHRSANAKAGTKLLATKVRSAQCDCWHKDDDMRVKTGEMVQRIMRDLLTA